MSTDHHARVKEIFLGVCGLPPEQRSSYIQQMCADDVELRHDVERLLQHHSEQARDIDPGATQTLEGSSDEAPRPSRSGSAGGGQAAAGRGFQSGLIVAGRYRIVSRLGAGGMGEVYRADDLKLAQTVALKFLPAEFAREPRWLERLHAEVRIARTISHPNVCKVYDIQETAGEHFIAMEYVDGEDLKALLKRIGRLPFDKAVDIARQLCAGLAAAHAKGVLHRDLKPGNIMLDGEGQVRLMDFGLAAAREEIRGLDILAGTPAYMSPEQLRGQDVSVRSDIYGLGLVLYEMFTGRPAFRADSRSEYVRQQQTARPPSPSSVLEDFDPAVERVILRCLERDPRDRPASALAVAGALPGCDLLAEALAAGETPSPEMVAAAGGDARLRSSVAPVALVSFIILLVLSMILDGFSASAPQKHLSRAPAVLADAARALTAEVGDGAEPVDEVFGFSGETHCRFIASGAKPESSAREGYAMPAHTRLTFWYRQASTPLVPRGAINITFDSARVTPGDPPATQPGMITVVLDATGRLLGYEAQPKLPPLDAEEPRAVDWSPFLAAARLPAEGLSPAEPSVFPRVYGEQRIAWRGDAPDNLGGTVRVEAAARRGQAVFFAVLQAAPEQPAPFLFDVARRRATTESAWVLLVIALIIAALPLTHLNLRRGRGDLRGARHLAAFVFIARLAAWLLQAHHVPELAAELELLLFAVVGALGEAALAWLFYIAMEPYVRRFWPQMMIGWSRMMAGRVRDPLVGRRVLQGALLGVFWSLMGPIDSLVPGWIGLTAREQIYTRDVLTPLLGMRQSVAVTIDLLRESVYIALFFLLLLVLLRMLLRRAWLASVVTVLAICPLYIPLASHPAVSWLTVGVCGVALGVWAMTHLGLLTLSVAIFVNTVLGVLPITFDFRLWYGDLTMFGLLIVCGVTACAFWAARSEARLSGVGLSSSVVR